MINFALKINIVQNSIEPLHYLLKLYSHITPVLMNIIISISSMISVIVNSTNFLVRISHIKIAIGSIVFFVHYFTL